jgi:hypothetical protein
MGFRRVEGTELTQPGTRQNGTKTSRAPSKPLAAGVARRKFTAMKTTFALLCSVLITVSAWSQTAAAQPAADEATPAKKTAAPGSTATTEKAPAPKSPPATKENKIEGVEVARAGRGFLGVQIVNSTFKISFYDAKKKPVAPDVTRAVLRWDPKYKVGKERVVLNLSEDGKSLTSAKNIRPPYLFKLYITLLKDASDAPEAAEPVGETHVIDFRA